MTISSPEKLGEHLRARRAQVQPEQVGVPLGDRRRVAGLRRKEVAELAGLGVDYYTRLEQGRERRPSASELNSLSSVLMLDDEAQRYLFAIEAVGPSDTRRKRRPRVSDNPLAMVEEWPSHPVVLLDRSVRRAPEFARRWARADVQHKHSQQLLLDHPLVDELDLRHEPLWPNGSTDVLMKIYRAEPGSSTAERLAMSGSLTTAHTATVSKLPQHDRAPPRRP